MNPVQLHCITFCVLNDRIAVRVGPEYVYYMCALYLCVRERPFFCVCERERERERECVEGQRP